MADALKGHIESSNANEKVSSTRHSQGLNVGSSIDVYHHDHERSLLIPGLPYDISLSCLARIPRAYHTALKGVCRSWRDLVCSEEWYLYRKKHNLQETWIYALCKDKLDHLWCYVLDPTESRRRWRRIKGLPSCFCRRTGLGFEVIGKKLYLFGGCGWVEDATDEMYSYDAVSNCWSEAAPLSCARRYFANQAVNGKIIVIGGQCPKSSNPQFCDTYDPLKNCWYPEIDHTLLQDIEDSIFFDGKIYVRCSSNYDRRTHIVVYEPSSSTWEYADRNMANGWNGPGVVVDGCLYVLNQSSGTRLVKWNKDLRQWVTVGRFSSLRLRPPCQLVSIGKKIYIVGEGLSTMVYDAESGGEEGKRVTLGLYVPLPHYDADVVRCRTLDI